MQPAHLLVRLGSCGNFTRFENNYFHFFSLSTRGNSSSVLSPLLVPNRKKKQRISFIASLFPYHFLLSFSPASASCLLLLPHVSFHVCKMTTASPTPCRRAGSAGNIHEWVGEPVFQGPGQDLPAVAMDLHSEPPCRADGRFFWTLAGESDPRKDV